MFIYLALLMGASFLMVKIWSMLYYSRQNNTIDDKKEGLVRVLEPIEEILEEWHLLGTGNVSAILRLTSKTSLVPEYVEKALNMLKEMHPLLQCAIVKDKHLSSQASYRYFRNVSFEYEMILKRSDEEANQWQIVLEEGCNVFDTANGPLWTATWLQETFEKNLGTYENTIIFNCHHAIVDGIDIMNLPKQFTECLNSISKGESSQCTNHYPVIPGYYSLTSHLTEWSPWQKLLLIPQMLGMAITILYPYLRRMFVKNGGFFAVFPPVLRKFPNVKSRTRVVQTTLSEEDVQRLLKSTRANNCTVTGAIASACHFALASLIQGETERKRLEFLWGFAVDVRRNCIPAVQRECIGYYAAMIEHLKIEVPAIRNNANFWKLAQTTSDKIHHDVRNRSHLTDVTLAELVDTRDSRKLLLQDSDILNGSINLNSISNIGCVDWPEKNDDTYNVADAFFLSSNHHFGAAFNHYITTLRGKLYWAICYNPRVVMETTTKSYVELIMKSLKEAIAPEY